VVSGIFSELGLKNYRFQKLKTFKVAVSYNGERIEDGHLPLSIISSEDVETFKAKKEEIRGESRLEAHKNEIYF